MGRTGTLWAYQATPVAPDAMTVAKALGGGLPSRRPRYGGAPRRRAAGRRPRLDVRWGPVVAAAARAALAATDPELLARVRSDGAALAAALEEIDGVREVRGRGLMLAAEVAV